MYEKILEYEEPPKPEIKIDDFEGGITTRLMAKRVSGSSYEARRSSLNFPPGSFVPNSNIMLNRRKSQIEEEATLNIYKLGLIHRYQERFRLRDNSLKLGGLQGRAPREEYHVRISNNL
ncbi:uncharacterized protein LOC123319323 isoform X2 [Coccinella septempunctata]|uniref:uncharacterized protein LOC123319323 isoform X2 n=1 Tax=Coccinella septempunctata TaxID=41139 RepID=UPI001D07B75A|nr:uncharacterized protein LOC123319323 isoform X2 [Coccinella septempunctata]